MVGEWEKFDNGVEFRMVRCADGPFQGELGGVKRDDDTCCMSRRGGKRFRYKLGDDDLMHFTGETLPPEILRASREGHQIACVIAKSLAEYIARNTPFEIDGEKCPTDDEHGMALGQAHFLAEYAALNERESME
jgi:hypothetical protein